MDNNNTNAVVDLCHGILKPIFCKEPLQNWRVPEYLPKLWSSDWCVDTKELKEIDNRLSLQGKLFFKRKRIFQVVMGNLVQMHCWSKGKDSKCKGGWNVIRREGVLLVGYMQGSLKGSLLKKTPQSSSHDETLITFCEFHNYFCIRVISYDPSSSSLHWQRYQNNYYY